MNVKQVSITNLVWTPLSPEDDCNYFIVRADSTAIEIRTNKADGKTGIQMPPFTQDGCSVPYLGSGFRYPKGKPVFYACSTGDPTTITVVYLK